MALLDKCQKVSLIIPRLKLFALDNNRLEDFSEKEINILLNLTKSHGNATEVFIVTFLIILKS